MLKLRIMDTTYNIVEKVNLIQKKTKSGITNYFN